MRNVLSPLRLLAIGLLAIGFFAGLCGIDGEDYYEFTSTGTTPLKFIVLNPDIGYVDSAEIYEFLSDDGAIRFSGNGQISFTMDTAPSHTSGECIKFMANGDNYAGKTVSIVATTSIRPIISISGSAVNYDYVTWPFTFPSNGNRGAFVSLNEVYGTLGNPFTLKFSITPEGTGAADFLDTSSDSATSDHFCGFGAPDAENSDGYISIVPSEMTPMSVIIANNAWSTTFGAVSCSGKSNTFENFYVGPIAPDSTFGAGTIFGVCQALSGRDLNGQPISSNPPECSNNFSNLTIGGIGANSTLSAKQSVFGGGYVARGTADHACANNLARWTIGPMGDGVSLTTVGTSSMTGRSACVFGATYTGSGASVISGLHDGATGICDQWTVEFEGSATVTAMAPHTDSANSWGLISTLGGGQNSNMRFYFNDLASPHDSRPIVVVAALRLGNAYYPWNIDNSNGYTATAYLDSMQENSTMATVSTLAVSLGPNLQLNVGRRRLLLSGWNELAQSGWKSPATNGTWEADASVEYGGTTFIDVVEGDYIRRISPGILTIIGGIAKAPNSADPVGAILRVNSGWEVNCFGYVRDLKGGISVRGSFENDSMLNFYGDVTIPLNSTITIGTRGAINLYRQSGPCAAFDKALKQVNDKAAFYADTSSAVALSYYDNGGTGLYQADKGSRAFTRKGDLQIGLSAGNDVTFGGGMVVKQDQTVQSNGTMTLGEGSKVRFAGGEHGGYLQLIGSGTTQQLSIGSGVKFSLLDTRRAIPCTFDYWIIRCPAGTKSTALGTLITGLTPGELADRLITENSEPAIIWGDNYYEITHNGNNATTSLLDLGGTAYEAGWQNGEIKLLWSDDSEHPGLFIVGRTPPSSQDSQGQQGGSGSGGENGENEEVALEAAEILRNDPKFRELIKGDKGEPGSAGEDADPYEIAAILASDEEFLSDLAEEIK